MSHFENVEIFHTVHVAPLLCTSTYHEHAGHGYQIKTQRELARFDNSQNVKMSLSMGSARLMGREVSQLCLLE